MAVVDKEFSAGAVLFFLDKEKNEFLYLILRYSHGHWDFPKGNIEKGEEDRDTAIREIKEETGITKIHFIDGFQRDIFYTYFKKDDNVLINKQVIFFLVQSEEKTVNLSNEHIEYKWLGFSEALKTLTFTSGKNLLEEANNFLLHSITNL